MNVRLINFSPQDVQDVDAEDGEPGDGGDVAAPPSGQGADEPDDVRHNEAGIGPVRPPLFPETVCSAISEEAKASWTQGWQFLCDYMSCLIPCVPSPFFSKETLLETIHLPMIHWNKNDCKPST